MLGNYPNLFELFSFCFAMVQVMIPHTKPQQLWLKTQGTLLWIYLLLVVSQELTHLGTSRFLVIDARSSMSLVSASVQTIQMDALPLNMVFQVFVFFFFFTLYISDHRPGWINTYHRLWNSSLCPALWFSPGKIYLDMVSGGTAVTVY